MDVTDEPMEIPTLQGSTIVLRRHRLDDLDAVYERCIDPDTRRWTTIPLEYTREDAVEYLTSILEPRADMASWAIESRGEYAGTIDLRPYPTDPDHRAGDIGFVTHPRARGRGVMSAAVGLVLDHGFDALGWEVIQWKANLGNLGSYKAAWRNGFPPPTVVEALLVYRGQMTNGWISTMRPQTPRSPQTTWAKASAHLA